MKVVKVLLNRDGFGGYAETDQVYEALKFESVIDISDEKLREIVFHQLNVDEPHIQWAKDYRRRGHRSFSVGDVVVVGDLAWACEPDGWKAVDPTKFRIVKAVVDRGHPVNGR
ncbi:hypothetical protein MINTMi27_15590 [Mycobacterium intracellulare]|uniref:hypothetical protein n=1 Tax=Mycobacterium intracellulare TaxID=1767 RepID=UPI0019284F3D|nr:hypothetical protein [Mycobacterium intracellulare]BCP41466.1 hypothetical protein MINTMi27_15590 [Mycobacterium intracellulare]